MTKVTSGRRRRRPAAVATITITMALAACGGGEEPSTTAAPSTTSAGTTAPANSTPATTAPATTAPATTAPATGTPVRIGNALFRSDFSSAATSGFTPAAPSSVTGGQLLLDQESGRRNLFLSNQAFRDQVHVNAVFDVLRIDDATDSSFGVACRVAGDGSRYYAGVLTRDGAPGTYRWSIQKRDGGSTTVIAGGKATDKVQNNGRALTVGLSCNFANNNETLDLLVGETYVGQYRDASPLVPIPLNVALLAETRSSPQRTRVLGFSVFELVPA